ncbi:MAG: AMMECR1 domain-containing protein [Armatimonadota bacterium]
MWSANAQRAAISIAQAAVRAAVLGDAPPPIPKQLPATLRHRQGCFVTLMVGTRTRGCMGTLFPREASLAAEIAASAALAAIADPFHRPIRKEELPTLKYQISVVLGRPWQARSLSELRPAVLGLCIRADGRGGVMLPGEARTARWQMLMARRKAGLKPGDRADILLFRTFTFTSSPDRPAALGKRRHGP